MMGRPRTRRRHGWVPFAVAALGVLTLVSWSVVSGALGSPSPEHGKGKGVSDQGSGLAVPGSVAVNTTTSRVLTARPVTPGSEQLGTDPSTSVPAVGHPPPVAASGQSPVPVTRTAPAQVSGPAAQVARSLISAIGQRSKLRLPASADNIALLARWIDNEGGLWADNPLNTSAGSASYPHQFTAGGQDTGIPIFPTMATGVEAATATLLSNHAYARILRVLRSGSAPCAAFAAAVIRSPWASGHYDHDRSGFCSGRIVATSHGQRHRRRG
jgi:hypothetical protein